MMKLFVGLGNPGPAYANTRHNIGWRVIDKLAKRLNPVNISKKSFLGELYKSKDILLLKPLTYMNLSGKSVQAVANFYKIPVEDIVVFHDDLDLPFGALRIKRGGGHGGHNGLKSIDSEVGKDYIRFRMGIDKPPIKSQVVSYVLEPFESKEEQNIAKWVDYTSDVALQVDKLPLDELRSRYTLRNIGAI